MIPPRRVFLAFKFELELETINSPYFRDELIHKL